VPYCQKYTLTDYFFGDLAHWEYYIIKVFSFANILKSFQEAERHKIIT